MGVGIALFIGVQNCGEPTRSGAEREGRVRLDSLQSPALGVRKRFVVYLPPSYRTASARRYPVAYYLHGAGEGEWAWVRRGHIDVIADSLAARHVAELIIVMPDGDDGYYTTWPDSTQYAADYAACRRAHAWWAGLWREESRNYCVPRPRYDDYLARDFVAHVDSAYRTLPNRAHRGIAGASMGGYGAVYLALTHPEIWGAAASHSGVLAPMRAAKEGGVPKPTVTIGQLESAYGRRWPYWRARFGATVVDWLLRDPCSRAGELSSRNMSQLPTLSIDVGASDPFLSQNRSFHDCLIHLHIAHSYTEGAGTHDWDYWRGHLGNSLRWLAAQLGDGGRRG
jgi:S-formylglutathione hydrolase FrmB